MHRLSVCRGAFTQGAVRALVAACLVVFAGCDGGDPPPATDAGRPDAIVVDGVAPTVTSTVPLETAVGVARDATLEVRFSEPMAQDVGTIRVEPGGSARLATQGTWDDAGNVLTIEAMTPWPSGLVTLTFGADFTDLAGNALAPHTLVFETVDDVSPSVVSTTPMEGSLDLSARLATIDVVFDEAMRTGAGTIAVLGGAATVGAPTWSADATSVSFPVADLEYERDYQATLRGFVDAAGNRLDGMPVLGDGTIDFSTGPDTDSARVVRAEPMEGQVDVNPAALRSILVTFDEVMNTSVVAVVLSDGTTDTPLSGVWAGGGRILRVDVPRGTLSFDRSYSLDLRALRDRAGNGIDEGEYLLDGRLDFTVGLDAFLPTVSTASPAEGETNVSYADVTEISVTFSESMDTAITSATLSGGAVPAMVTGTWSGTTQITFDVTGLLGAGTDYSLDLSAMQDTRGNALDPADPYTGDARLDFQTGAPSGEGCLDPLRTMDAMEVSPGVFQWTLGSLQGAVRDGGTAFCDYNGSSSNGTDVLVRFDKVSGDVASGGRVLHLVLDASSSATGSNAFDIAVATGACDASATPIQCHPNAGYHEMDLDLPAGPVWIWVSRSTLTSSSSTAILTATELMPPTREGDSCLNPFTSASSVYTAPSGDMVHRFSIPENAFQSVAIGPYGYQDPGYFSCDTAVGHGIDGVVRFDKMEDTSVLRVTARRTAGSDTLNVEVFDACDVSLPTTRSLGCQPSVSSTARELIVDAPAGPVFVWVGDSSTFVSRSGGDWRFSSGADIEIEVIPDVANGEICSRALPALAGPNAVTGTSDQRFGDVSCFDSSVSAIEWYRVTASAEVTLVRSDAAGGLVMVDPATRAELACVNDGLARSLTRVLSVGQEVCVGVEMGRSISSFTVSGQTYTGLGRSAPVDLGILRPFNTSGSSEESVTSDYWMVATDSSLLMRHTFSAVLDVGRGGMERGVRRGTSDGVTSSMLGRTAISVGGALFAFTSSSSSTSSRVTRLWDGRSPIWAPTTWDLSPSYATSAIQGVARVGASDFAYVTSSSNPVFYQLSATAPGAAVVLGTNAQLTNIRGMTADNTYFYVSATVSSVRGIYRVPIADVSAAPVPIAISDSFATSTTQATAMEVDSRSAPAHLYVRNNDGDVEVIIDPSGASPFYLGPVISLGTSSDWVMTLHEATGQLYLFETETESTGRWVRFDP